MVNCQPVHTLWLTFRDRLGEEILHQQKVALKNKDFHFTEDIYQITLLKLHQILIADGYSINDFPGFPQLNIQLAINNMENPPLVQLHRNYVRVSLKEFLNTNVPKLNAEQRSAFQTITRANHNPLGNLIYIFFIVLQ